MAGLGQEMTGLGQEMAGLGQEMAGLGQEMAELGQGRGMAEAGERQRRARGGNGLEQGLRYNTNYCARIEKRPKAFALAASEVSDPTEYHEASGGGDGARGDTRRAGGGNWGNRREQG